jgi:hypothetical protein
VYPRAKAAWSLYSAATDFANYGLCMAGPTGPTLLRDTPREFWVLVRRRLITSAPESRPFEACARLSLGLTGDHSVSQSHLAEAQAFVEFGGVAADQKAHGIRGGLELSALHIDSRLLAEQARQAWPFVRGGYTKLVKPSMGAVEAAHPVELPSPVIGSGLPGWEARYRAVLVQDKWAWLAVGQGANLSVFSSSDHGLTWGPARVDGDEARGIAGQTIHGDRQRREVVAKPFVRFVSLVLHQVSSCENEIRGQVSMLQVLEDRG